MTTRVQSLTQSFPCLNLIADVSDVRMCTFKWSNTKHIRSTLTSCIFFSKINVELPFINANANISIFNDKRPVVK